MSTGKKEIRLYNVLFPVWMLLLIPTVWIVVLPGNFIIDSLVLAAGMAAWKIGEKKQWYKRHILKIYLFGMLSDVIGSGYLLLMMLVFEMGQMGDELYLTLPAVAVAGVMIFVFNYFVTFKDADKVLRIRFALLFALATAPYTFMIPSSWIYGY